MILKKSLGSIVIRSRSSFARIGPDNTSRKNALASPSHWNTSRNSLSCVNGKPPMSGISCCSAWFSGDWSWGDSWSMKLFYPKIGEKQETILEFPPLFVDNQMRISFRDGIVGPRTLFLELNRENMPNIRRPVPHHECACKARLASVSSSFSIFMKGTSCFPLWKLHAFDSFLNWLPNSEVPTARAGVNNFSNSNLFDSICQQERWRQRCSPPIFPRNLRPNPAFSGQVK